MMPISYEVNGFPEFLRSEAACRRAVERGLLKADTWVIAYGENNERKRMLASEHPLLRQLLEPSGSKIEPVPVAEPVFTRPAKSTPETGKRPKPSPVTSPVTSPVPVAPQEVPPATPADQSEPAATVKKSGRVAWLLAIAFGLLVIWLVSNGSEEASDPSAAVTEDASGAAVDKPAEKPRVIRKSGPVRPAAGLSEAAPSPEVEALPLEQAKPIVEQRRDMLPAPTPAPQPTATDQPEKTVKGRVDQINIDDRSYCKRYFPDEYSKEFFGCMSNLRKR